MLTADRYPGSLRDATGLVHTLHFTSIIPGESVTICGCRKKNVYSLWWAFYVIFLFICTDIIKDQRVLALG